MSEFLDKLKEDMKSFPITSNDPNIITSVVINEYNINKKTLDTVYRTSTLIKSDILLAVDLLTSENYNIIIKNLNDLNAIISKAKKFEYKVDSSIDITTTMTVTEQARFLGAIPESVFNLINYMKLNNPTDPVDMPSAMGVSIENNSKVAKDNAIKNLMGSLYDTVIFPFIEYQSYIDSNNIKFLIDKLANIEYFLIPKYSSPRNFMHTSGLLYSKYYMEQYMINNQGKLKVNRLSSDTDKISKIHNILSNIEIYYS
jgi:hypothetical protein